MKYAGVTLAALAAQCNALETERDRLQAENERLREALHLMLNAHPRGFVTADVGACGICGGYTPSGMIHTCEKCADKAARAALGEGKE